MAPYQSSTLPNLSWYFFQRRIILTLCLTNASTATYGPLVGKDGPRWQGSIPVQVLRVMEDP